MKISQDSALMLGMLVSALHKQKAEGKLTASFRPSAEDRHFARSLEASLRTSDEKISSLESQCLEGHFHILVGIFPIKWRP